MCIKYDLKVGIMKDFYKYIVIAFIILFACVDFYIKMSTSEEKLVMLDYILYIFRGMYPYIPGTGTFEIPVFWFVLNLYLAYIIGKYPKEDLYSCGINMLIKSKSRLKWWLSKCLWCILSCAVYYVVIYIVIFIFCVFTETDISMQTHMEGNSDLILYTIQDFNPLYVLFLPFISSVALSLFQLTFILFTEAVYGFIAVAVILVSSAYVYTPFLIGNISMAARNEYFYYGGINTGFSYFLCIILGVLSVIVGAVHFKNYDITRKE